MMDVTIINYFSGEQHLELSMELILRACQCRGNRKHVKFISVSAVHCSKILDVDVLDTACAVNAGVKSLHNAADSRVAVLALVVVHRVIINVSDVIVKLYIMIVGILVRIAY